MDHPRMMEKVQACEAIIHHGFNDPHLCWEALQVAGSGVNHSGTHRIPNGNKRLAVVGDAVIDLILSEDWFESGANEGYWTDTRMRVSSNANLHAVGIAVALHSCMHVNPKNPVSFSQKIMATAVEAVIGAVFLDGGLVAAKTSMHVLGLTYNAPDVNMCLQMSDPGESSQFVPASTVAVHCLHRLLKGGSGSNIEWFPVLAPMMDRQLSGERKIAAHGMSYACDSQLSSVQSVVIGLLYAFTLHRAKL